MKRLLCLLSGMDAGGAETFLMKMYRQMDRNRCQMDFCINKPEHCFYEDEIYQLGGKIFRIPCKSESPSGFAHKLKEVVQNGNYKHVLRITSNAAGFWDLKLAKQAGAEVCAARSSNSSDGAGWKPWLAHRLGRLLYGRYVDVKIAPSDLAAIYTFGQKSVRRGEVFFLHNALDLKQFAYSQPDRERIRAELGVENKLVIGHVGRFDQQKNHKFLLNVFAELKKLVPHAVLLLIGKGELEDEIRSQIRELDLADSVQLLGVRNDVPKLLCAMDAFLLPSFYEGMPNTVIEAQTSGLPCVISDTITAEAAVTPLVQLLPLELSAEEWARKVLDAVQKPAVERAGAAELMRQAGYDIESCVRQFEKLIFGD